MNSEIYYFSGTGNSLYVARNIAKNMKGKLIPIASVIKRKIIDSEAGIIGIVFPVYFSDLPVIVKNFIQKLNDVKNKYLFAVCTFGGGTGDSFKTIDKILKNRGGGLSGKYGIHMPQNAFLKPWENNKKIIDASGKYADAILKNIRSRKKGFFLSNIIAYCLIAPFRGLFKRLYRKSLAELSKSSAGSMEKLINISDKSYSVNENCNGCGICSQVCPVDNIKISNKRPVWLHHCEACLACYNWCPKKAIRGGASQKDYYYRNPCIKVKDMIID